ncbi:TIGR03618 family F420-dependent PPOX class oxidoreductase [Streptomyces lasiicapitis]|uniref:pyridoxamine 5'-phosphate oxidase family protein n=1 Tax=Streptomyces TaxID=1883 RepID=UPI0013D9595C|nr:TIGR03618 family F420-dependent PPOX class oxidoreductase [Streptomyces aureoverticillatus]QIB48393.1 TIGR03618 family F420-dependent PPOX class oxidoreductase [Streptomyces aureoverticillatus]
MSRAPTVELPATTRAFLTLPHTAALTTLRADGTPHVTPVRFTFDAAAGLVRVTTRAGARKARNVMAGGPAARVALCQADGFRWVTLEGRAAVTVEPARLAEAVRRYIDRYRAAPPVPRDLVVVEIAVDRVLSLNLNRP